MPLKPKRARQATAQRASGSQFFDRSFSDSLNEFVTDSMYNPTSDSGDSDSDEDEYERQGWAFSLVEGDIPIAPEDADSEWEDVEDNNMPVQLGKKRQASEELEDEGEGDVDAEEAAAVDAVDTAERLWRDFFSTVSCCLNAVLSIKLIWRQNHLGARIKSKGTIGSLALVHWCW